MGSRDSGTGSGALGWALGLAAGVVVVAIGLYVWTLATDPPVPDRAGPPLPADHGASDEAVAAAPEPAASAPAAEPDETAARDDAAPERPSPRVDVVRVDPDGNTVIAGTATPGSKVVILLDNAELAAVRAGADGAFVSLLNLPLAATPRVLSLLSETDGVALESDDRIILAPSGAAAKTEIVADTSADTVPETDAEPVPVALAEPAAESVPGPPAKPAADTAGADPQRPAPVRTASVAPDPAPPVEAKVADPTPSNPEAAPASGVPAPSAIAQPAANDDGAAGLAPDAGLPAPPPARVPEPETAMPAPGEGPAPEMPEPAPAPTPAAAGVAVLRSGADGVELLQPAVPDDPLKAVGLELDTISYSSEGDVLLRGRARDGALVRVYLDNAAVADLAPDDGGRWRGALKDVAPGVYTLRLDELGAGGKVLNRLETPFQRASPDALQSPAGADPESAPLIRAVTVQAGDTLWAISRERYGDGILYVRVFEANRDSIRNPDLIYPGQVFSIPE
ncbi:LysM peptidoglycan-binding domain-containing protein [Sedimentitalea sp. JM2-8]|uniref:LysM peptidoglycan-binding domain-containing protein n=1 Tax=Sedimentitalea xiamensis TaxID=3050037 RepID=A0ABT7FG47_9RHOB|nr:LysM peptidoglycan-binding domain-containing protein [Sedimentitalea xiamensis]MDK3074119.1 LysM peptidoglycan-binding domain-containing protein [Sedimentitalea xiamensis]